MTTKWDYALLSEANYYGLRPSNCLPAVSESFPGPPVCPELCFLFQFALSFLSCWAHLSSLATTADGVLGFGERICGLGPKGPPWWVSTLARAIWSGEGNGNPLHYSCLVNPVDRGAWWASVHGVTQSQTQLKQLSMHACSGEENGNPLQYSCLENPRDGGTWWAAIYGFAQSWTRLKWLSSSSSSTREALFTR